MAISAGSPPAGSPWASAPTWPRRSSRAAHTTASFAKPRFANYQQGWPTRANEALGGSDQITPDGLRAIAFAFVEAMMSSEMSQGFSHFVAGMLEGGDKLDDMLQGVYRGSREEFINYTGEWIAQRYGQLQ